MRTSLLVSSAIGIIGANSSAQQVSYAYASNEERAEIFLAAVANGEAAPIRRIAQVIRYSPTAKESENTTITAEAVLPMFKQCEHSTETGQSSFRDMLTLEFACKGRQAPNECGAGNLSVLFWPGEMGVVESQKRGSECRTPAPPPSNPRDSNNG